MVACKEKAPDAKEGPEPSAAKPSFVAADVHRVDVVDVIKQAHAVAVAKNAKARLTYVVAHGVREGCVDATGTNVVGVDYQYRYDDPTKAPGGDVVAGRISFKLDAGELVSIEAPPTMAPPGYVDEPSCSSEAAWQAAVGAGMPENAVANMELGSLHAWSIRVPGHKEHDHDVDTVTCKVTR